MSQRGLLDALTQRNTAPALKSGGDLLCKQQHAVVDFLYSFLLSQEALLPVLSALPYGA